MSKTMNKEIRLKRSRIILKVLQKPVRRLGKRKIDRRAILADYEDEIKRLEE